MIHVWLGQRTILELTSAGVAVNYQQEKKNNLLNVWKLQSFVPRVLTVVAHFNEK